MPLEQVDEKIVQASILDKSMDAFLLRKCIRNELT